MTAEVIPVPNGSFELPPTTYAYPLVNFWQQFPATDFSDETTFRTGVFSNQPPSDPSHIANCDGAQALFLFAVPGTSVLQDYESQDYLSPLPLHAFTNTFEVGKSYKLTVGVLGGTNLAIPMSEGTTLDLNFYYRDNNGSRWSVATTTITNRAALFPTLDFVDFSVETPVVKAGDPWAGRHIGLQLLSTTPYALMGGYWDLDNVRLASSAAPVLLAPELVNSHFRFTVQSEPGLRFDILAAADATLPAASWSVIGAVTNQSGSTVFTDPSPATGLRFYQARQLP